jgi:hypothetical protein
VEFGASASCRTHAGDAVGQCAAGVQVRVQVRVAAGALQRRFEAVEQGRHFRRFEHRGFDEQRRPGLRHERRVFFNPPLNRLATAVTERRPRRGWLRRRHVHMWRI